MKLPESLYKRMTKNPSFVLGLSFLILIAIGTALLSLPLASANGKSTGLVDALFTATSASCVTGLVAKNTAAGWTLFGKTVIILLIQVGGLGTMTMLAWVSLIIGKRIGLSGRMFIKEQLNASSLSGLVRLLKFATFFTLTVEGIGAALLSLRFVPAYGVAKGVGFSLFHAISSFCNAGFDLFGDSLMSFQDDAYVTVIVALLIIFGGLGFIVYVDLWHYPSKRHIREHTKLVLWTSLILLVGGTLLFYIFEANNPETLKTLSEPERWLASFFQSASFRTAGFNSVNLGALNDTTVFLSLLLMFVGGSPGSTAGGLKTTTFAVVMAAAFSTLRGLDDTVLFRRRISEETIKKAFSLFVIAIALVFAVAAALTIFEAGHFRFMDILFETVSAFGTVGVTRGITDSLHSYSKLILAMMMFIGRIGPTTFTMGMFHKEHKQTFRYAEGKFIVG